MSIQVFDWTNEDWARTFLPWVRLATFAMTDPGKMRELAKVKKDSFDDLLDG